MHPVVAYELAKIKIEEAQALAQRERSVRGAGSGSNLRTIDAVAFRQRLGRLFGGSGHGAADAPSVAGA